MDALRRLLPYHPQHLLDECVARARDLLLVNHPNYALLPAADQDSLVAQEAALLVLEQNAGGNAANTDNGDGSDNNLAAYNAQMVHDAVRPDYHEEELVADLADNANDPPPPPPRKEDAFAFATGLFPDADPAWLLEQIDAASTVQDAVDAVFELNGNYPKRSSSSSASTKAKKVKHPPATTADAPEGPAAVAPDGKLAPADVAEDGHKAKKFKRDFTVIDPNYERDHCYYQWSPAVLQNHFRNFPKPRIVAAFNQYGRQLIPTYLYLEGLRNNPNQMPFKPKKTLSPVLAIPPALSAVLDEEIVALEALKENPNFDQAEDAPEKADDHDKPPEPSENITAQEVAEEANVECNCCYGEYTMENMTQCEDGHLFCLDCARRAAENLIGLRKTAITCLDSSGCKYLFPRCEIERFLTKAVLVGYDRLVQEESLRIAGISDLEACPFCDYGVIMATDPNVDKLFTCRAESCGVISCRLCKRKNHIPQTCEEAAKDDVLNVRHKIEEAMTQALLRTCPSCSTNFFKTEGCNKMSQEGKQCHLWDDSVVRNAKEVEEAGKLATSEAMLDNPEVDAKDIHVEAPVAPEPRLNYFTAPALPPLRIVQPVLHVGPLIHNPRDAIAAANTARTELQNRIARLRDGQNRNQQVVNAALNGFAARANAIEERRARLAEMRKRREAMERLQQEQEQEQ
ncbi:hypothetical protein HDU83_009296 [Entophlyctis luteolus]|nr:hypothetical protein HDU83_009296 [Entophlyctis luteolus]